METIYIKKIEIIGDEEKVSFIEMTEYEYRNFERSKTLSNATMQMVGYFMALGDDQPTAETKVKDLSTECAPPLYVYTMGNSSPLFNDISNSALPYMDATAKAYLIAELSPEV